MFFTIPVMYPGRYYRIRLFFIEMQYHVAGKRVFHVDLDGTQTIPDIDIFDDAGSRLSVVEYEAEVYVDTDTFVLSFEPVVDLPVISKIEMTLL